MNRSSKYVLRVAVVWVVTLAALGCEDDYDEAERTDVAADVVSCEEAYARLRTCCPDYMGRVGDNDGWGALCLDFQYSKSNSYGCDGNTSSWSGHVRPALNLRESVCIRATSCDALRNNGVCLRVGEAVARGREEYSPGIEGSGPPIDRDRDARPEVCP
ncbi:MAG: hypothetical protein KF764_00370 [Labilithrix sp.]|nr:hypothetical protein [Labilithrix sp.]